MLVWLRRVIHMVRNISGRGPSEAVLDEELRGYVELLTAEKMRAGMSAADARREAILETGGMEQVKERVREARSGYYVSAFVQDVKQTLRALRKNVGYTTAIVLTLALGVGATTAIFTVVRAVLLRQLPYEEPDRLVRMWPVNPAQGVTDGEVSVPELEDWRNENSVFSDVAAYRTSDSGLAISGGAEPIRLNTAYVTPQFFNVLGIKPYAGRVILPAEHADGANRVVVLSYDIWKSRWGGDRSIVGRTITVENEPFTVVGIMPPSMRYPSAGIEVWTPASVIPPDGIPRTRDTRWLQLFGRLRPGISVEEAQVRLSAMQKRLEKAYPDANAGWTGANVKSLRDDIVGPARGRLIVIFATVLLILLLGCVNIANLVLARATQRTREIAVRAAIGASRGRLIRQLMTESIVLSLIGGGIGIALAWWGSAGLVRMSAAWLPLPENVKPDWLVLGFALVVTLLTGVAFGLIPATASFTGLSGTLRENGRSNSPSARSHGLRRVFVAIELALALILVAGASLFVQSFARLSKVDMGFDVEHTAYARMGIPDALAPERSDRLALAERMMESVKGMPGVVAVGSIKHPPLKGEGEPRKLGIVGRTYEPGTEPVAGAMFVNPGFFDMLGMKVVAGRDFVPQDDSAGAVVISQSVARTLWGDRDPVGQGILIEGGPVPFPVVGVVNDIRYTSVDGPTTPMIYVTRTMMSRSVLTIMARGKGDPTQLLASLRDGIHRAAPDMPITEVATMRSTVDHAIAAPRFLTFLLTLFGALAVVLAAIGVYGVVSYVVGQRRNEIGIRMALGARAPGIVALTMRTGMAPVAAGLALGLAGSAVLSRLVRSQLFEVRAGDPMTYVAVVGLLTVISIAATSVPAIRAARVDPTTALRAD